MKAILEFELPEDLEQYKIHCDAVDMSNAVWDFKQYLRSELKYNPKQKSEEYLKALEEVQEKFFELFGEFEHE